MSAGSQGTLDLLRKLAKQHPHNSVAARGWHAQRCRMDQVVSRSRPPRPAGFPLPNCSGCTPRYESSHIRSADSRKLEGPRQFPPRTFLLPEPPRSVGSVSLLSARRNNKVAENPHGTARLVTLCPRHAREAERGLPYAVSGPVG